MDVPMQSVAVLRLPAGVTRERSALKTKARQGAGPDEVSQLPDKRAGRNRDGRKRGAGGSPQLLFVRPALVGNARWLALAGTGAGSGDYALNVRAPLAGT